MPITVRATPETLWAKRKYDWHSMAEHFKNVQQRKDEQRGAAYFNKKAFAEIATFPEAVEGRAGETLVDRFKREGIPQMYLLPPPDSQE
jgi:hypothetical protein